jgi:hypothetical protein
MRKKEMLQRKELGNYTMLGRTKLKERMIIGVTFA